MAGLMFVSTAPTRVRSDGAPSDRSSSRLASIRRCSAVANWHLVTTGREHKNGPTRLFVDSGYPPNIPFVTNMRFLVSLVAILSIAQAVTIPGLLGRTPQDSCGSLVNAMLEVSMYPHPPLAIGVISTSLALSSGGGTDT